MISKITICNLALAQLGQAPISSLTQEDEKARRLNLFYEPVRDEVLRSHNWGFATAEEPLALVEKQENSFLYKYPQEALFIRRVYQEPYRHTPFRELFHPKYRIRVLESACPQAWAEYTRRAEDENQFDSAFVKSFSLALAADLAVSLTGDNALAAQILQKYTLSLDEARRSNMTENFAQTGQTDAFTEVR